MELQIAFLELEKNVVQDTEAQGFIYVYVVVF